MDIIQVCRKNIIIYQRSRKVRVALQIRRAAQDELDINDAFDDDQFNANDDAFVISLNFEALSVRHVDDMCSEHRLMNLKLLHFRIDKQHELLLTMVLHALFEKPLKFNATMLNSFVDEFDDAFPQTRPFSVRDERSNHVHTRHVHISNIIALPATS